MEEEEVSSYDSGQDKNPDGDAELARVSFIDFVVTIINASG